MSLEELLRSKVIRRIRPDYNLALKATRRSIRDIDTAKTLIANKKFDWALAVSYNAMLSAGRALMFNEGYRPSSSDGHVAVVKFLQATLDVEVSNRMIMIFNEMRKKRHRIVYEEMDIVSEDEARRMVRWAEEFVKMISGVIRQKANQNRGSHKRIEK